MIAKLKIALTAALLLASCRTLKDDYRECGVWLEFVFDHNMEYTDSFAVQVRTMDVAVFDDDGQLVRDSRVEVSQLAGRKRMWLGGLPMGRYTVLCVGNYTDEHFTLDNTALAAASFALKSASTSRELPRLFCGGPVEVSLDGRGATQTVSMMRHTNRFDIAIQSATPSTTRAVDPHTAAIVAPEAGIYDIHDRPIDHRPTVYRPYTLAVQPNQTAAKINTMRLLESESGGYRISVHDEANDHRELWGTDLLPLLAATKPAKRPDGTELPPAEYLDRQDQWNIVIVHRGDVTSEGSFVVQRIVVNGWVVWQQGMEL